MITKLGVDRVIETARKLGITTPIGRDMSISLGTADVKLAEMVHAYGVFAAGGYLADQIVVTSITDREGKKVDEVHVNQKPVISEESAFIMAHMMKGVIDRGTATMLKKLGRPIAGKTGTTNEEMDAWFVGYTPEWSAGVWAGFDQKRKIGNKETGGKVAAPIFLYFMEEFLKDQPILDFEIPDGVVPVLVNVNSGRPTSEDDPAAFVEYFKNGTEPGSGGADEMGEIPKDYLSSSDF
jgi:penicillin-binding protein 1A